MDSRRFDIFTGSFAQQIDKASMTVDKTEQQMLDPNV